LESSHHSPSDGCVVQNGIANKQKTDSPANAKKIGDTSLKLSDLVFYTGFKEVEFFREARSSAAIRDVP